MFTTLVHSVINAARSDVTKGGSEFEHGQYEK